MSAFFGLLFFAVEEGGAQSFIASFGDFIMSVMNWGWLWFCTGLFIGAVWIRVK